MSPLGLFIANLGGMGGNHPVHEAVVIDDYMWKIHNLLGAGHLTPLELGTVTDFHDTWDLITISTAGHYQPQTVATVSDEGFWDVHTISSGNDAIKPLDV